VINFFEAICVLPFQLPVMANCLLRGVTAKLLKKKYIARVLVQQQYQYHHPEFELVPCQT